MIDLFKPYMPKLLPEVETILNSGKWSYGKWGHLFESTLSEYISTNYVLATNTYSNAINIALAGLGLKPGDEILMSPMTCLAANMPVLTYGAKIRWCDIDPTVGTLSLDSVRSKINKSTKAIIHNHFCGYIGYVEDIRAIADEFGLFVIDDCIEAFGSEYKGKKAGNLYADATIFSFQTVRLPNCIEGGAVCFKNREGYERAIIARDFGIHREIFRDEQGEISRRCDISTPGFGATPIEMNSYIGCKQLEDLPLLLKRQQRNAEKWSELLCDNPLIDILHRDHVNPNYWVYGILAKDAARKTEIMLDFRNKGYYASGVHVSNANYSVFGNQGEFNGVEEFNNKFIAIPSGWWMNNE